jgi:predicted Holliday junction resolvase-like endonuclease
MEDLVIVLLLGVIVVLFVIIIILFHSTESRARKLFSTWSEEEMTRLAAWRETECSQLAHQLAEGICREWKLDEEKRIREEAIKKSREVMKGKASEHLCPVLPGFSYDPRDARFIGSPVDFVVFDGLSMDQVGEIIFLEVKTGARPRLSGREQRVREAVQQGRVRYEQINLP